MPDLKAGFGDPGEAVQQLIAEFRSGAVALRNQPARATA